MDPKQFETMKALLERIATAIENEMPEVIDKKLRKMLAEQRCVFYSKEEIIKIASEDELFALFHTFKEYYNEMFAKNFAPDSMLRLHIEDYKIGEIVKKLKANYK